MAKQSKLSARSARAAICTAEEEHFNNAFDDFERASARGNSQVESYRAVAIAAGAGLEDCKAAWARWEGWLQ